MVVEDVHFYEVDGIVTGPFLQPRDHCSHLLQVSEAPDVQGDVTHRGHQGADEGWNTRLDTLKTWISKDIWTVETFDTFMPFSEAFSASVWLDMFNKYVPVRDCPHLPQRMRCPSRSSSGRGTPPTHRATVSFSVIPRRSPRRCRRSCLRPASALKS